MASLIDEGKGKDGVTPARVARWCDIPVTCRGSGEMRTFDGNGRVKSYEYTSNPSYKVVPINGTHDEVRVPLMRLGDVITQISVTFDEKYTDMQLADAELVFSMYDLCGVPRERRVPVAPWSRVVDNTVTVDLSAAPLPLVALQFTFVTIAFRVPTTRKVTVEEGAVASLGVTYVHLQHERRKLANPRAVYPFHNVAIAQGIVTGAGAGTGTGAMDSTDHAS